MFSIIKSHFHKGKIGFFITGLFIILSVFMMIIGLSICFGMDSLYANAKRLSNSPDCWISVYDSPTNELRYILEDTLKERDDIDRYDVQPSYYIEGDTLDDVYSDCLFFANNKGYRMYVESWMALNIDDNNNKFKPYLRNTVEKQGYKFYVTGNLIETSFIEVGDKVYFTHNGKRYEGYIAGIFDDMTKIYSTGNIYVSGDLYEELTGLSQEADNIISEYYFNISFNCKSEKQNTIAQEDVCKAFMQVVADFNKSQLLQDPTSKIVEGTYGTRGLFKNGTRGFILLLGTAMTAFAVIVAVIVAIVIAFLVRSSVLDEVRNLGVWKALGYTTSQLRLSYLSIYSILSGVSILIGTALGIGLMPTFVDIITSMARLDCSRAIGVNAGAIVIAILLVVAVIAGVVYLATSRVKRITPLSAMRNNLETHSFRRNRVPLSSSKISLNAHLGIKSIVGETHRSIMVVAIILIMSMLCSFVSVIYYNLKVDQTAIESMSAVEMADIYVGFNAENDDIYFDAISEMEGFEANVVFTRSSSISIIEGERVTGQFYSDYEYMRSGFVYKGRYPKYSNEILIENQYAKSMGWKIGDNITITMQNGNAVSENSCVIVGYFQNIIDNTVYMGLTDMLNGIKDLDWKNTVHLLYFEQGKAPSLNELRSLVSEVAGGNVSYSCCQTGKERMNYTFLNTVSTAADAVMSVFISITAIVIALLLVMLIKLKLLRERRNFAIYKALGYTTFGIMSQIATAMLILGVIGSLIGAIVGAVLTSPLLSLFGGFIGAGHFAFAVPWGYTVCIIIAITLLVYCVSMLCAIPVKKILPSKHLRERN